LTYQIDANSGAYACILENGLKDVVDELHEIDPVDLVSFIRFGSFSAIEDLLQSSTELFFKEGTLTFAWTAGVEMDWGDVPTVTLGMEFHHRMVSVFFNLSLRALDRMVVVGGILFDPECHDPIEKLDRLSEAVADAHLPKRVAVPSSQIPRLPRDGGRPLMR
jgi:hypothetical protein